MAVRFDALNRLLDSIRQSNHDFRETTDIFPSLDVEKLARNLDLYALAVENGNKGKPAQSAKSLDDVEQKIVAEIEEEKKGAFQLLSDQYQTFSDRLRGLDLEGKFGLIRKSNVSSLSEFTAEVTKGKAEMHGHRRKLKEAEDEIADFKDRNKLRRAARVSGGTKLFFSWSVIIAMVLIETIMNGMFLAKGSEQGIIGGVIQAFVFAALNIGVSLLVAIFWAKWIVHRFVFAKVIGLVGITFYVLYTVGLNLALAHFRESAESSFASAGTVVIQRLQDNPFGLADLNSWTLFGIGILMSIIAFIDGWYLSDPYPGYGGTQKRVDAARAIYVSTMDDLIDNLRDMRDEHNDKVDEVITELGKCRQEAQAILAHRNTLTQLFIEHQNQLERTANTLLTIYREENRKSRTEPEPKYFLTPFKLAKLKPGQFNRDDWDDKDVARRIQESQIELTHQSERIGAELELAIKQYHELDNLFPEGLNVQTQSS